jgi:hypothetical protein
VDIASYIAFWFLGLAVVFFGLTARDRWRKKDKWTPGAKARLRIGCLFLAVALWLFVKKMAAL